MPDIAATPVAVLTERIPMRVFELGGAAGALLHWWRRRIRDIPLCYTAIEPYPPCIAHMKTRFPKAELIEGDAEAFADMDFTGRPRFTVFMAATVFCMIHPDVVRRCLIKAASFTDDIFIRDYSVNIQGSIESSRPLMFYYTPEADHPAAMFAHHYEKYFAEIGFKVDHLEEARTEIDRQGWAFVHARRTSA